jgi:hypothetical protein
MPQPKGTGRQASASKENDGKPLITESERRLVLVGVAVLLLVVAVVVLLIGSIRPTPLQSCKSIVFSKQRYDCIYALANSTNNYSICSLLAGSGPSQCITLLAEREVNASGCGKLGSSPAYSSCMENISYMSHNVGYCLRLNGSNESSCAFNVAKGEQFMNLSECSDIRNASSSLLCSDIYYYNAASRLDAPNYCSYLPDVNNHTLLSIVETKDYVNQTLASESQSITTAIANVTVSASCYYNTAILTKNRTLCSYSGGTLAASCSGYLNSTTNNTLNFTDALALCSQSPYGTNDLCYYALYTEKALSQRNISSCFSIANSSYKDTCIVELASTYNDSSYCSSIANNTTDQQACYSSASYGLK